MDLNHLSMQQILHPTLPRRITNNPALFVSIVLLFCSGLLLGQEPFVIVVQTDNRGVSGDSEFLISTDGVSTYDYSVDWTYDGTTFNAEDRNVTGDIAHNYGAPGTYTIAIQGTFPRIFFNDNPNSSPRVSDAQKLIDILQWGDIAWGSFAYSFAGCVNLIGSAEDEPDLSGVTSMEAAFAACSSMNMDVSDWNVAPVQNFSFAFSGASSFNRNLGNWDLSNATNLTAFLNESGIDQSYYDATLDGWAAQTLPTGLSVGVRDLTFCQGEVSRKMLIDSLGWSFANDKKDCPFVIVVKTDNPGGFTSNTEYMIPTSNSSAYTYNYQVDWTYDGTTFNIEDDNVTGSITHDYGTPGTYTIAIQGDFPAIYNNISLANAEPEKILAVQQWGSITWGTFVGAFSDCPNLDITAADLPDLSNVSVLTNMFANCPVLQGHPSMAYWDVSTIQQFNAMFSSCVFFNQDLGLWDVRNGITFSLMFNGATLFNQDISNWDVSNSTDFSFMFSGATHFNQDIGNWNVSNSTTFFRMFSGATLFNQDIGNWDVSNSTTFGNMFNEATHFNHDLGQWNVSNSTTFNAMFRMAAAFNQDISNWNVSQGTNFSDMFRDAAAFNQDISNWNVSQGTNFSAMFRGAAAFNQDISSWDVSNGTNFGSMFYEATHFSQDLGQWEITRANSINLMLAFSGMDVANYDATLIGWAAQAVPNGLSFGADGLAYCDGADARSTLINTYGWNIFGDQLDCSTPDECPDDRIVTQADIAADITLRAGATLETDGTVTITAGQNVTFTAGQTITLKPGFTAAGPFSAVIENCPPMMAAADEQIATDQPAAPLVELPSGKNGPVVALEVVPNPAYDQTNLRFDLTEPSTASLTLHSLKGETLRTLLRGHRLAAGRQQISLRTADLPPGFYLIRLQTAQGVQTAKVVVTRN